MGTNCAPLEAGFSLFCYERDFMLSLSGDVNEAFSSASRYLDDLLNIDNNFFDSMINHTYPSELQANVSDTEASFFAVCLSIYLYRMILLRLKFMINENDKFDFDIVNFPFLDGDVPRSTSYGVYISQLIQFA